MTRRSTARQVPGVGPAAPSRPNARGHSAPDAGTAASSREMPSARLVVPFDGAATRYPLPSTVTRPMPSTSHSPVEAGQEEPGFP
ncbi:hypothetical protein ADL04_34090 [Streptomyces sp. NRRL B-3648]|nr:hypothetical protein ADL04_34090 [Streptomyces sp. NRRL B-3648]